MGTVPEPEPQDIPGGLVVIHKVERAGRILIAGSDVGAVRRIALYTIVAVCLVVGLVPLGLVALMLLATTDVLR